MERTFLEFFAGIGLVRVALESRGWAPVFANDIDPGKYRMYADNFPDAAGRYIVADIHHLRAGDIPTATLAQASFPCVDLSLAGYRRGLNGRRSGSYWGFVKVLEELGDRRPPIILIENVVGFLSSDGGEDFRVALEALGELGYSYDAFVLNAVHFVPQSRPRLFVIGMRGAPRSESARLGFLPPRDSELCPSQLSAFMARHNELKWCFLPLPSPPPPVTGFASLLERLEDGDPRWWSEWRVEYLLNQMSARHRRVAESMITSDHVSYGTVYRRIRYGRSMAELRTDGVAGCLRTPKGGSSRQILFVAGRGRYRARLMTPREYARLQGVPEGYRITVPPNQALFGFGDAVCVPAIQWIAENALNPLAQGVQVRQPAVLAT